MTSTFLFRGISLAALALILPSIAHAGRPLNVDDAGTNARGEGHVEVWATRADDVRSSNISPAYAIAEGLEVSALLSRLTPGKVKVHALQVKYLITPSKEDGCNFGMSGGAVRARASGESANGSFVNGIGSCNGTVLGNLHVNIGYSKPSGEKGVKSWGVALEREVGPVTPHIEYFGAEQSKPIAQLGLRGDIAKGYQLDGTVARIDRVTAWSLGFKFKF